ncbi:DNA-binding protein RFX2-like isoform X3 [Clavelina lepadiformis]|uniref:DNA-binding protein RFX2-like isoform X3 n=1 Tax=Clavelina lepadiformis TaxID=159417 RepID=UPI004042976B
MQQNVAAAQQSLQVVSATQNQLPVARYVSVVASKTDSLKSGDNVANIIKPTQPHQNRQLISVQSNRPLVVSNPISLNIKRVPAQQPRTQQIHVPGSQQSIPNGTSRLTVSEPSARLSSSHVFTLSEVDLISNEIATVNQLYQNNNTLPYVDSSGDHVYTNGSTSNSFQYQDGNQLYSSSQQNNSNAIYFDSSSGSTHVGSQATVVSSQHQMNNLGMSGGTGGSHQSVGQLISSPGGSTYIIQNAGGESGGIVAMPISHTTRASPATVSHFRREPKTVQWLMEHFENTDGVSLPRALMYNHYLLHCQEQQLDPVNAASFGKLVRSVFIGLRTRRLGTRGNSKYHYYGIRIKGNSPLNRLHDEINYIAMRQQSTNHAKRYKSMTSTQQSDKSGQDGVPTHTSATEQVQQQAQQHQQYLGDATQALPDLDPINITADDGPMPVNVTQEDLMTLEDLYRDHCANVLDIIVSLQFSMVETLWQTFWRAADTAENQQPVKDEYEMKLPRQKLLAMCKWAPVQRWIKDSDHMMYQSLVEVLIPDVLRPIPSALTLAIRNFAKGLENGLTNALAKSEMPQELIKYKVSAVSAFSQTLRRYTSLNHLAQAARAVLNDNSLISQMLSDLNRVDFANVQEQASWVCQCDDSIVTELEADFKAALSEQRTLEQWADWLENVVVKVLQPHEGTENFTKSARQFLLKWCFYSSMVIRDLTLRSAASFGSFHLIRLLYDEYMFYLVEHRVAQATGETAIAVMGDFSSACNMAALASPASSAISESSTNPPAFVASALISTSNNSGKQPDKGVKRSASEMEAAVISVVQVNGKPTGVLKDTGNDKGKENKE